MVTFECFLLINLSSIFLPFQKNDLSSVSNDGIFSTENSIIIIIVIIIIVIILLLLRLHRHAEPYVSLTTDLIWLKL